MALLTAPAPPEPFLVIPNLRPLFFAAEGTLYCARFDRIYSTRDFGQTLKAEGRLETRLRLRPALASVPLAQRVTRAQVYRMRVLPDGTRVFVFRRGAYVQAPGAA